MKTLSVSLALPDKEAELLLTKYSCKELEGVVIREGHHALFALLTEIKSTIPYVAEDVIEE